MKIYYYKDPSGNFGDDINPWLWPKLMPGVFNDDDSSLFVGIGTLINHRLPKEPRKHIFGSGFGYGTLPKIDDTYTIYSVRGFETARLLNLTAKHVITDPAILVRTIEHPKPNDRVFNAGFMPHGDSLEHFDWEVFCNDIGFRFISCRWDVERVISEISQCKILLAEAMHGAIVADSLRTPWIPISCYGQTLDFKWRDWLSTMNIDYCPRDITPVFSLRKDISYVNRMKIRTKQAIRSCGFSLPNWTPPPPYDSSPSLCDEVKNQLLLIAKEAPFLSDDRLLSNHTERYLHIIDKFVASETA